MPRTLAISNRLLRALAADNLDPLRPHFEAVAPPHKQTLSKPGAPIEHVHFIQERMVSLVLRSKTGP